ncbi:hypothetical protein D7B24_004563 [Verticillium nonalfalfae]|uniref:Uncharacterized protein n=1 Tax=Verticillium nonalfalfae TaxID=1051616 RepID=A0A3M9YEG8_9PEZI|nr:uncharacterized protein D7B24_004563 [Verticillium nonalfalfae]RNJ58481.1 hypothetical protein D7B24_004563 [Verticillium nonalfalfae]
MTKETIEKDLTTERPQWILSAYGPGRDAPEQLFGGSVREQSFEEMRLHHVLAASKGSPQQALNEAQQLYQQAEQQIQTTVRNLDGAIQFIIAAGNSHPNRIDICKQNTLPGGTTGEFLKENRAESAFSQASPFQSNSGTNSSNPFSSHAQSSSPFGGNTPSSNTSSPFGQAHNSGASTFGQPSSTSAFGQPNALGQKPSPFGTPAFGQASQPTSAFGQPPPTTSAFGKPAFGQPAQPTPAFSQPGQPSTTSAFGQASALGQKPSPFGAPSFGQASQPAGGSGAFGQTSALGQKPNPFGNPTQHRSLRLRAPLDSRRNQRRPALSDNLPRVPVQVLLDSLRSSPQ